MPFFHSFNISNKGSNCIEKGQDHNQSNSEILFGIQQWSYYQDLIIESSIKGHCTISSELVSFRYSRLHRSLYNLIYTPNDEVNYFILYMESCSLSSYLKFILDINTFDKIIRENFNEKYSNDDQQTAALSLFHRYLSIDAIDLVPISDEIRRTTLLLICPANDSTKPDPDCFRMAREHIWELIEQSAYPDYLQSTYHINYQIKILTSNQLQLHDILYHTSSLSYFVKYAEQEKITDLLQFWFDVEHFNQNIMNRNIDNKTLKQNALDIYERYISLQAPLRLGFDDSIRAKIECSICQPDIDAGPSVDTFDQAAWIVYIILQREYFPKFLESTIFYRYISDLMLQLHHKDSTHQTKIFQFDTELDTISIDSEDVIQPVSLNRQRNISKSSSCSNVNQEITSHPKGRFSMGYIDPLGRFIRDPNVDSSNRKTYSKPFQFITQFVRNEQDEIAIEEAAARFAETFINEITNRTENFDHE